MKYLKRNKPQIISINIGTGKGSSVLDIVKTFHSIDGVNFDYDFELKTQLQKLEEQLEKIEKFNIPTVIHFWESYDIREIKNIILG